jgi:hypothetical protein
MNLYQRAAVNWMDVRNLGTVMFEGDYRFPEAFRRDPELAHRFFQKVCMTGHETQDTMLHLLESR